MNSKEAPQNTKAAHTPGPWRYVRANPSPTTGEHLIAGATPGYLAEVRDCGSGDVAANARRIVQCVNSHDDLLAALQMICDSGVALAEPIEKAMTAAIAKATGGAA